MLRAMMGGKERLGVSLEAAQLSELPWISPVTGCCRDPLLLPLLVWPRGQESLGFPTQGAQRPLPGLSGSTIPRVHFVPPVCTTSRLDGWKGGLDWAVLLWVRYPPRPGKPPPALLNHQVLVWNSEDSKEYKFEPGLPGHCEGLFVRGGRKNVFYLIVWFVILKILDNWYVYLHLVSFSETCKE